MNMVKQLFTRAFVSNLLLLFLIAILAVLLLFPPALERLSITLQDWFTPNEEQKPPLTIAFVSTLSGPWAEWGRAVYRGVEVLVDEVNAAGGIDKRTLILRAFDDKNDPDEAMRLAEIIAADDDIIAVIGHDSNINSRVAGNIYQRKQIPAITPIATDPTITQANDWYFRTIFDQQRQARVLAHYVKSVLNHDSTAIIYANNNYGSVIANKFTETAASIELAIQHNFALSGNPSAKTTQRIVDTIADDRENKAVLLVVSPKQAEPLVNALKARRTDIDFVSTNAPSSFFFSAPESSTQEQQAIRYTDRTFFVVPFIEDTANAAAQRFLQHYSERYGTPAIWPAIYGYDSALLIINALRNADLDNAAGSAESSLTITELRNLVRQQLSQINSVEDGIPGLSGLLYFNQDGNTIQPVYLAQVRGNHLAAASQQLQLVDHTLTNQSLSANNKDIVDTGDALLQITQVIHTGLQLDKIYELDDENQSFKADFKIWFRFSGDFDPRQIVFPDAVNTITLDKLVDSSTVGPERYQVYQVDDAFNYSSSSSDLINSRQKFAIRFHHAKRDRSQLIFVPDRQSMELIESHQQWHDTLKNEQVLPPATGWIIDDASVSQEILNRSTLGNPVFPNNTLQYSAFYANVSAHKGEISLKRQIQTLLQGTSSATFFAFGILFLITWLPIISRRHPLTIALLRLLLGTILFYLFETLFFDYQSQHLETYQLQIFVLIFKSLWWIVPAIWINTLLPLLVWQPLENRTGYPVPHIARTFIKLGVYSIAALCILAFVFEQPLTTIWAASGVITLVLGFALQNMILDAFSGLMLNLERPFKIAHWIQVTNEEYDTQGRVEEINWRTTRIRTEDNNLIVIPNSVLSQAALTNYSAPIEASRLEIPVSLALNVSVIRAQRVLAATAKSCTNTQGPVATPAPYVIVDGPDSDGMHYRVVVHYIRSRTSPTTVTTVVIEQLMSNLHQAGLAIAGSSENDALDWYQTADRTELLSRSDLFNGFDDQDVLTKISHQLKIHILKADEDIIRQGGEDDYSMYGLGEGLLSVHVNTEGGEIQVATIKPGAFFGEMSLLAGEPRSATVRATSESLVYEIKRELIENLLRQRPELADKLSRQIAERKVHNAAAVAASAAEREQAINDTASLLLKKMFEIFGGALKEEDKQKQAS